MKKLIAISVVFALLTGAAFAQVTLGANMWAEANLIYGNTEDHDGEDFFAGAGRNSDDGSSFAKLTFSYETDGGEAGVAGKFENDSRPGEGNGGTLGLDGAAWWKPIPQLKLLIGGADFDRGDNIGWTDMGFISAGVKKTADALYDAYVAGAGASPDDFDTWYSNATNAAAYDAIMDLDPGLPGEYKKLIKYEGGSKNWFGLSIIPMDMFTLNISVIEKDQNTVDIQYGTNFMLQAVITIPNDFGELAITYDNSKGVGTIAGGGVLTVDDKGKPDDVNNAFFMDYTVGNLMGLGLAIDFGFSYYITASKEDYSGDYTAWFMGLGAAYTVMDGLVAKLLFDTWGFDIVGIGANVTYTMDFAPWTFELFAQFFANIFIDSDLKDGFEFLTEETMFFKWEVQPKLSQNIGGFTFSAALNLQSTNMKDAGIDLKVPVRFSYSF